MSDEELHLSFNEAAKKYYPIKPASNTVETTLIEFASWEMFADPRTLKNKTKTNLSLKIRLFVLYLLLDK